MLNLSLFSTVWYFKEDDNSVPFLPLIKTYDCIAHKWIWLGLRLDKSDTSKGFLNDTCRSLDKIDLRLYKNYIFNDIFIQIPADQVISESSHDL